MLIDDINRIFSSKITDADFDMKIENIDGFDSFKKVELLLELESQYKLEFTPTQIDKLITLNDILSLLKEVT